MNQDKAAVLGTINDVAQTLAADAQAVELAQVETALATLTRIDERDDLEQLGNGTRTKLAVALEEGSRAVMQLRRERHRTETSIQNLQAFQRAIGALQRSIAHPS
jgi:hypothetical protein